MTRQEALEEINKQEPTFLQKASKRGYICPYCNQGAHKGNGITRETGKPNLWYCIGCTTGRSVTGLFAGYMGIPDDSQHFPEIVEKAAAYYGVTIDEEPASRPSVRKKEPEPPKEEPPAEDFTDLYRQWAAQLDQTDYFTRRGISAEIVRQVEPPIGYCPDWINPKARPTPPSSPRVIMPSSAHGYTARDTRAKLTPEQEKHKKQKRGKQDTPFNAAALRRAKSPVFVTEGEINALSIMEAGKESDVVAVATGSASYTKNFVEYLQKHRPPKAAFPLLISMDNDTGGQLATARLKEALTEADIPFQIAPLPIHNNDKSKDANDLLLSDPAELKRWTLKYVDPAAAHMAASAGTYVQAFFDGVAASADTPAISTGFKGLDKDLSGRDDRGGLYPGLYFIGALSSLGKTTFCLQICDAIAKNGSDVLIFSLEMARSELISKSISRLTAELALAKNLGLSNAKSSRGITDGARYVNYSPTEIQLIRAAAEKYQEYATDHIWIYEGVGNIGVKQIRKKIEEHIEYTKRTPVVLIDYLQILSSSDPRATEKQNIDKAVIELKRISRDFNLPLICISSFNRNSYNDDDPSMAAFKESGGIEYSSDVLITLQTDKKRNTPSSGGIVQVGIKLTILKNRNGGKDIKRDFTYYPVFNYFMES